MECDFYTEHKGAGEEPVSFMSFETTTRGCQPNVLNFSVSAEDARIKILDFSVDRSEDLDKIYLGSLNKHPGQIYLGKRKLHKQVEELCQVKTPWVEAATSERAKAFEEKRRRRVDQLKERLKVHGYVE